MHGQNKSAWRLHTHFDVDRGVPTRIDVTGGKNSGKTDEKNVLRAHLEADHCYVMDRWYAQFTLFNEIHAARQQLRLPRAGQQPLRGASKRGRCPTRRCAAGVLSDALVELGAGSPPIEHVPTIRCGLVRVRTTPSRPRGKSPGGKTGPPSTASCASPPTSVDVPAEIIAEIYRHRWTIELFFRFFKHVLGCRHLLSTARAGIEIQTYCAIIACLLLALWTGGKPTLRTLRNDLPLPARLGRPGGAAGAPQKTQASRRSKPALVFQRRSVPRCARMRPPLARFDLRAHRSHTIQSCQCLLHYALSNP